MGDDICSEVLAALQTSAREQGIPDTSWDRVVLIPADKVREVHGKSTVPANHVIPYDPHGRLPDDAKILGVHQRALIISTHPPQRSGG